MSSPGILPGGSSLFNSAANESLGMFGKHPGATPKYSTNRGIRDAEYRESMARLFVEVPNSQRQTLIESLPTETQALARVLTVGAREHGGANGTGFIDFLLTDTRESFQEKEQIVDTLTDNYVAFYAGQSPALFTYSGMLLNTYQDDQRVWMLKLYRDLLRGSRLAGLNLTVRLRYDSFIVTGYMTQLSLALNSAAEVACSFNFAIRVKHMSIFTPSLGVPTQVRTAATSNNLVSDTVSADVERVGVVGPTAPVNPTATPAATTTANEDPRQPPGRENTSTNTQNVSSDGAGGATNVSFGEITVTPVEDTSNLTVGEITVTPVTGTTRRTGRRARGVSRPATPTGGQVRSESGSTQYVSAGGELSDDPWADLPLSVRQGGM